MLDLTYEQTIELEKNVQIKNEANQLYSDFVNYFQLRVSDFKNNQFEDWSDSHNRCYLTIKDGTFIYSCRFINESYDMTITPSNLFSYIKSDYRGLGHFRFAVNSHKERRRDWMKIKQESKE